MIFRLCPRGVLPSLGVHLDRFCGHHRLPVVVGALGTWLGRARRARLSEVPYGIICGPRIYWVIRSFNWHHPSRQHFVDDPKAAFCRQGGAQEAVPLRPCLAKQARFHSDASCPFCFSVRPPTDNLKIIIM
jgi:hypothetical protein